MKIKLVKQIDIMANRFTIKYDKTHNGGSFSMTNSDIIVGIKCVKKDPLYTISIISHELMEIILCSKGCRFENGRTGDNFLFNFSHQEFENAIQLHTEAILKFIG